jgi:hypothetical protein
MGRSKFLLADFYGRVLIPPTYVPHNRVALDAAIAQITGFGEQFGTADGPIQHMVNKPTSGSSEAGGVWHLPINRG